MSHLERVVTTISALCFAVVAFLIAVYLPNERSVDPLLIVGLVIGYAVVSTVRFEFGSIYVTPEQLVFIPMLLLLPLPLLPALVGVGVFLSHLPDFLDRSWHRDRWVGSFADWFCVGPVLVVAAFAPGEPSLAHLDVYALAFLAQVVGDLAWALNRDRLLDALPSIDRIPLSETLRNHWGVMKIDAMLTPTAWGITLFAVDRPIALLMLAPLVLMLGTFAQERNDRYAKALELQRAYRGTVMLLSEVVEFEDAYTAEHSRGVMDLVHAVADELGVAPEQREQLEFAAMLHDVGKIAIPKEILHKPSKLTHEELTVIKRHTIEGQSMLDQVGGLLDRVGQIVRSCHERWDGKGYPDGLKGEEIPLAARIVFYCDAFNAMTTNRVYRGAMTAEAALAELDANAGTQFDPRVAEAGARVVRRLQALDQSERELREVSQEKPALSRRVGVTA